MHQFLTCKDGNRSSYFIPFFVFIIYFGLNPQRDLGTEVWNLNKILTIYAQLPPSTGDTLIPKEPELQKC